MAFSYKNIIYIKNKNYEYILRFSIYVYEILANWFIHLSVFKHEMEIIRQTFLNVTSIGVADDWTIWVTMTYDAA